MLCDGVAAAECDAAICTPAAEIPAEDLQEFIAGIFPYTLFQCPVGADGCAGKVMTVLALVPVYLRGLSRLHGDGACRTDRKTYVTAFVPFAGCLGKHQMLAVNPAFRVCAPTALQRTACHKYCGAAAGSVMDRKGLNIKNMSACIHRLTPVLLCSARSRKHHILHMSSFLFQSLCMCRCRVCLHLQSMHSCRIRALPGNDRRHRCRCRQWERSVWKGHTCLSHSLS